MKNRTLYNVYNNPSMAKRRAWVYCEQLCGEYNGHDLRIASYNTYMFTADFNCMIYNKEYIMHITKTKNRLIAI